MTPLEKSPLQTFKTFIEEDSGVLECIIGVFEDGGKRVLQPVAARVVSGVFEGLSNDRLQKALEAHKWAQSHPKVFTEARVDYDT
jgi:hypothetical protein